ncbi:MAG: hypothetical protein AAGC57_00820 [Pseudomonadota bacterium]
MPLDRIVLYIVAGAAACGVVLYVGLILAGAAQIGPLGLLVLLPLGLVAYIAWRVIVERLGNREDDHYDRIER